MSNGEMVIGYENDKPPMTYCNEDGILTGFDIEFAKAICSKLGIDIIFKEIKWDMKETELETKSIDCVWSSLTLTEPRRKFFEFTIPYIYNKQTIVIRRSNASKYTDTKSLSKAKIAAGISTAGEEVILSDSYLSQSDYIATTSQLEALDILKNELCDAIIIDYTFAKYFVPNDKSEFMIIEDIHFQGEQFAVGFRHGSDMSKKVNSLFLNMILDGSLTTISEKYNLYDLYAPIIITDYDYIMNKGKIIVGFLEHLPPMNNYDENGQLTGFDIDFAKAVFGEIGIDVEFKSIIWDDKVIELNNRNIDCIWSALTVTEERGQLMKFSRVYMTNTQAIMIRKSDASKYTDLNSFFNIKMSASFGSIGESVIKTSPYFSNSKLISLFSSEDSIIALNRGEVDAIVIDYTIAIGCIDNGYPDLMVVKVNGINFDDEEYAVGFRLGSDMTIKVNEIMNRMMTDGKLESLAKKYNMLDLYNEIIEIDNRSDIDHIMLRRELIIGIETNSLVMSNYNNNGRLAGFDIEFATAICSKLGIYGIFKIIDWDNREAELNDKNIDCILNSLSVLEENNDTIEFSIGYLINKQVVVIRKSDESKYTDIESLSGAKMSAVHSTLGEKLFKSDSYLSKAKYMASSSKDEVITALKNESVDAIVIDFTLAKENIESYNSNLMIVEGINFPEEQYKIGFRTGSEMVKKVNNAILDMNNDGTLATLVKKYDLVHLFKSLNLTDTDYIIGKGKMVIGYYREYPPLNYNDSEGQLIGFDVEFSKAICTRLGIDVEFKKISWDEKEIELKNRSIDCIWNGLTVSEEHIGIIKYSRTYMSYRSVVVIRKSDMHNYNNLESLSRSKISAVSNTIGEIALNNNKYLIKAQYVSSSTLIEAIIGLEDKKFDGIVIDSVSAIGYIANGYPNLMILAELTDVEKEEYAIGFRAGSDMTVKINKLINEMINDDTLELIAKKYGLFDNYKLATEINENSDLHYIMSKGEMIIGIDPSWPPISYYDEYGELTGFDTEFAKAVCSKLSIDAIFKKIDWSKKEEELNSKNIDCVWDALTVTEERQKYFKFTTNYLSNRQTAIIRSSDASKFTDTVSLSEAKLTAVKGAVAEIVIKEDPDLSKANYTPSITQNEAIIGLKNKSFDAFFIDYSISKGIIDSNDGLMIIKKIRLHEEQYAVGFRIDSDITEKVNYIMLDMMLDGTLNTISKRYGLVDLFEPVKITDASYIMNKGNIIIGFDKSMSPMTYYDSNGHLTGFDIDFATTLCHQLGINPEFKEVNWTEKEYELKNRNIDCFWSCLSITDKRREIMKFSRVYMNNKQIVVIRKSNIVKYNSLESLSNAIVSSKIGTLGESVIKTYLPNAKFQGFSNLEDSFIALEKGNIDAVVTDYTMAKDKINNGGFSDLIIIEKIELIDDQYAIGFRLDSDMTKKVNAIIKNMMSDGTINEIAKKYNLLELFTHKEKSSKIWITVFSFMASFLVLILVL